MGKNGPMESGGKHAGKHRTEPAPKPPRETTPGATGEPAERSRAKLLALALGVTLAIVAWGYLVYAAIDFGAAARGGETSSWWLLGLASLGAVACLFVGLLLVARLLRTLQIIKTPDGPPTPPRPVGGKRAAR